MGADAEEASLVSWVVEIASIVGIAEERTKVCRLGMHSCLHSFFKDLEVGGAMGRQTWEFGMNMIKIHYI